MPLTTQESLVPDVGPCSVEDVEVYARGEYDHRFVRCRNCTRDLLETGMMRTGSRNQLLKKPYVHFNPLINIKLGQGEKRHLQFSASVNRATYNYLILVLVIERHTGAALDGELGFTLFDQLVPWS